MATSKKPLNISSDAANSPDHSNPNQALRAEYKQRQRSLRPLPSSVAKAYEVLIARQETQQEPEKDTVNG